MAEFTGKNRLNAPRGILCFLTEPEGLRCGIYRRGLNAPRGILCFLTIIHYPDGVTNVIRQLLHSQYSPTQIMRNSGAEVGSPSPSTTR